MAEDVPLLAELQHRLGHIFADPGLLELAVTHRSWANEQGAPDQYERLEFLGDAVLGLITADWLYRTHPDEPEGELARLKSYLVSDPVLAHYARELDLGEALRLGLGEERSGGRHKRSLLADSMEAVFGAVYLDGGIESARQVIHHFLEDAAAERPSLVPTDAKTRLQEALQARGCALPEYRLQAELGPDHRKIFHTECRVDGEVVGRGEGRSKKSSEQQAAAAALEFLDLRDGDS